MDVGLFLIPSSPLITSSPAFSISVYPQEEAVSAPLIPAASLVAQWPGLPAPTPSVIQTIEYSIWADCCSYIESNLPNVRLANGLLSHLE